MKINFDTKKSAEAMSSFLQKTSDAGKKAVENVQKSAVAMSEKAKQDSYERRMKKYNPLFADIYLREDFCLPSIVVIVDDAVRRGIDVCEGAIGWRGMENDTEILYLYDEAVKMSGLNFVPTATCNTIYYADAFNEKQFIQADLIFDKAHKERLAELEHVAHALGAKRCSIEISETKLEQSSASQNSSISGGIPTLGSLAAKASHSLSNKKVSIRKGKTTAEFAGSNDPQMPILKWFAHDEIITKLIDMRCSGDNSIKSKVLELSGSSSATMSRKTAIAIDGVIKESGLSSDSSMESQANFEHACNLIFSVEF